MSNPFKQGDKVRLKKHLADGDLNIATVLQTLDEDKIEGGLLLDCRLNDFRFWNAEDVDRVSE